MKIKKIIMSLGIFAVLLVMSVEAAGIWDYFTGSKKEEPVKVPSKESKENQGWLDWFGEGLETAASFGTNTEPTPIPEKKEKSFTDEVKSVGKEAWKEVKEVGGEILDEGKKELKTAAKVAVAAGVIAGVGTAATLGGVFKDWLVEKVKGFFNKEENPAPAPVKPKSPETVPATDHSKQKFYAEEIAKLESVKESIDQNNVQEAAKKIQDQQAMWKYLPDVTKEEQDFKKLASVTNALKQQLVEKVSAGIDAILQKINENSLADIEEENSAAQSRFEGARSFEDAQKAINRIAKNSTAIENMANTLAKLGNDVKAVITIVTDNAKFNDLVTKLNNAIKDKFDAAAAQQLLQKTKALVADDTNKLEEAKKNEAAEQTNAA